MKKIAKVIQAGRSNPSYYFSTDLGEAVKSAVSGWKDTDADVCGNRPESEAYEIWLVAIDEDEREWSAPETLETGTYHAPPMAERAECEGDYVYQPLLTGKRMQIHKEGAVVRAFDHKGRALSGDIEIGETTANLSKTFLTIAGMDIERAIFDAVMLSEDSSLVFTDILLHDDCAVHQMCAVARMDLLAELTAGVEGIRCADWGLDPIGDCIARPAYEGYFSEWRVVEGLGRNNGDKAGAGPDGKCICPECGTETEHETGKACNEQTCPDCVAKMTRK